MRKKLEEFELVFDNEDLDLLEGCGSRRPPAGREDSDRREMGVGRLELRSSGAALVGATDDDDAWIVLSAFPVALSTEEGVVSAMLLLRLLVELFVNFTFGETDSSASSLGTSLDRRIRIDIFIRGFLGCRVASIVGAVVMIEGGAVIDARQQGSSFSQTQIRSGIALVRCAENDPAGDRGTSAISSRLQFTGCRGTEIHDAC
jgi:hypothetical protein